MDNADHQNAPPLPEKIQSQPSVNPKVSDYLRSIVIELLSFAAGLAGILSVVFGFGYFVGGAMISRSGEYFGLFQDSISLILIMPLVLGTFGLIALVRRDWVFLTYPLVAFFLVGPSMYGSVMTEALGLMFPFHIEGLRSSNEFLATTLLTYGLIYSLERPLSKIITRGRFKGRYASKPYIVSSVAVLLLSIMTLTVISFNAPSVVSGKKLDARSVRMPQTQEFTSSKQSSDGDNGFTIYYNDPTPQYGGTYNMRDKVIYEVIKQGQSRSLKAACDYPGSDTKKTEDGFEYISHTQSASSSNENKKTLTFTEYKYCFVLDDKSYTLIRSDEFGSEYLSKYPTNLIITAFTQTKGSPDIKTDPLPQQETITRDNSINPNAYTAVGYLDIKEWGIRIPLTNATTGSYYVAPNTKSDRVTGGLSQATTKSCSAKDGSGTFYIARQSKAEAETQKRSSTKFRTPHKAIGNYNYAVYANGNAKNCLSSQQDVIDYEDALDWATVNIAPM